MIAEKTNFAKSIFFDSELDTLVLIYTKLYCGALILLSKPFTVIIQPLSTRLIKPNFCFHPPTNAAPQFLSKLEIHFQNYTFA